MILCKCIIIVLSLLLAFVQSFQTQFTIFNLALTGNISTYKLILGESDLGHTDTLLSLHELITSDLFDFNRIYSSIYEDDPHRLRILSNLLQDEACFRVYGVSLVQAWKIFHNPGLFPAVKYPFVPPQSPFPIQLDQKIIYERYVDANMADDFANYLKQVLACKSCREVLWSWDRIIILLISNRIICDTFVRHLGMHLSIMAIRYYVSRIAAPSDVLIFLEKDVLNWTFVLRYLLHAPLSKGALLVDRIKDCLDETMTDLISKILLISDEDFIFETYCTMVARVSNLISEEDGHALIAEALLFLNIDNKTILHWLPELVLHSDDLKERIADKLGKILEILRRQRPESSEEQIAGFEEWKEQLELDIAKPPGDDAAEKLHNFRASLKPGNLFPIDDVEDDVHVQLIVVPLDWKFFRIPIEVSFMRLSVNVKVQTGRNLDGSPVMIIEGYYLKAVHAFADLTRRVIAGHPIELDHNAVSNLIWAVTATAYSFGISIDCTILVDGFQKLFDAADIHLFYRNSVIRCIETFYSNAFGKTIRDIISAIHQPPPLSSI